MSTPGQRLGIYLNDHLAGATAGLDLAKRAAENNEGSDLGFALGSMAMEIDSDREQLREVMRFLQVSEDHLKMTTGWVSEKFARLKLNGELLSYSPLSRMIELEGLVVGITGKRALWLVLQLIETEFGLQQFKLNSLIDAANDQLQRVETFREQAAQEAFMTELVS